MINWHKADLLNRMHINIGDGKKAAMPRYYKNKIYTNDQRSEISGYHKGQLEQKVLDDLLKYDGNSSYAREKNQAAIAAYRQMYLNSSQRQKTFI